MDFEAGVHALVQEGEIFTLRQLSIMMWCYERPRTVRGLAAVMNVSKASIVKSVNALTPAYVLRKPEPGDMRSVEIYLTAKGVAFIQRFVVDEKGLNDV